MTYLIHRAWHRHGHVAVLVLILVGCVFLATALAYAFRPRPETVTVENCILRTEDSVIDLRGVPSLELSEEAFGAVGLSIGPRDWLGFPQHQLPMRATDKPIVLEAFANCAGLAK